MGIYYNLKKSIIRAVVELSLAHLTDGQGTSFPSSPVSNQTHYRSDLIKLYRYNNGSWTEIDLDTFFLDLDLHATEQEIPNNSLLVTRGYTLETDEHFVTADILIGVMIQTDTNAVEHDLLMDKIFTAFLPTKTIPIFDMTSGALIGEFQVKSDISVMPMMKSDQRPLQFLGVSLASNITVNLLSQ